MTNKETVDPRALLEGTTQGPWVHCLGPVADVRALDPQTGKKVANTMYAEHKGDQAAYAARVNECRANARLIAAAPQLALTCISQEERIAALEAAAQSVIAQAFDYYYYYTARNGKRMSIEGDDGEKCWIIPIDAFEELRALTNTGDA